MNSIKRLYEIDEKNLSGEFYFESLLKEALRCGILNESRLENIMMQCIDLLAYSCERLTKGESSSVKIETAQAVMASNLYTIGLYLKSLPDPMTALERMQKPIQELYEKGRMLVDQKRRIATMLYEAVQKTRVKNPNHAYNATLNEGIGSFFAAYDADFQAHEIPASIDYPLLKPVSDLAGVEYIVEYLQSLYFENAFCQEFDAASIHEIMLGYHKGYSDLLINLCEQVLKNALGCILSGGEFLHLCLEQANVAVLQNMLEKKAEEQILDVLKEAFEKLCGYLSVSGEIKAYLCCDLALIAQEIRHACDLHTLQTVFVPTVRQDVRVLVFSMGTKMPDDVYRDTVEELNSCRYWEDKYSILCERIASLIDLEDLLSDCSFSEQEVFAVLDSLENIEAAALLKRHPYDPDDVDESETELLLRRYLDLYLQHIPGSRQDELRMAAESMAIAE